MFPDADNLVTDNNLIEEYEMKHVFFHKRQLSFSKSNRRILGGFMRSILVAEKERYDIWKQEDIEKLKLKLKRYNELNDTKNFYKIFNLHK